MKYNHWLPKFLTKIIPNQTINAIVVFKVILFRDKKENVSDRLVKHEQTHVQQQKELGIKFYFLYFKEYIVNRFKGMSHFEAYWNISFEVEARKAERL